MRSRPIIVILRVRIAITVLHLFTIDYAAPHIYPQRLRLTLAQTRKKLKIDIKKILNKFLPRLNKNHILIIKVLKP